MYYIFCLCVFVALIIQHAMRMRHIMTSFMASLAPPYFPHYLKKSTIFGKKLVIIKCVFSFSLESLPEQCQILKIIQHDTIRTVRRCSCRDPVIPVGF